MITKERKSEIIKEFSGSLKNTGSIEVQIALLTEDIEILKEHFAVNKKDLHSKRGFIAKINKRKKLLLYLKEREFSKYASLIKKLGLRK